MYEECFNIYKNELEKRELEEQKKRQDINENINEKKNKNKEAYEKKLNENKFRHNLKKIKDINNKF